MPRVAKKNGKLLVPQPSNEAVYYVRVSSAEQEEEGYSIPAQVKAAQAYAAAHGLTVVREFVDVETAKKAGRKQFQEMMTFLKKSRTCRTLIVEKTDRLYRNLKDWVELDELISERDLAIHLYKESTVLTRDARSHDKFIHGIKVLMARSYIDNLSEEVRKGMTEKAEQGHYPGAAPVGYLNNPITRQIDLDPTRAPIVRRLFELYAAGQYSLSDLKKVAANEGLTNNLRSHQPLGTSALHRMLDNPIYVGKFRWKEKLYDGKHTPPGGQEPAGDDRVPLVPRPGGSPGGHHAAPAFQPLRHLGRGQPV